MQFVFIQRDIDGRRPTKDDEGVITSLGVFGEHVDENSTHITENVQRYYAEDPDTYDPTSLEVGEFVTVEVYRGNIFRICDLYRVS